MKSKFKGLLEQIKKVLSMPEMGILPGQLAFFFVLSLIPLIALLGSLAGPLHISINTILDFLDDFVPTSVVDIFEPIITGKSLTVSTFIFYISSFILASNGTHSMILASNAIYNLKNKDYLSRRIKALIMTFVLVDLLIFILAVPAFGDKIIEFIISYIKNQNVINNIIIVYGLLKYPVSFIFIYFNIKLLYTMAPDSHIKSKYTSYGSLFTTLLWIVATEVYSIYVDEFSKYNLFYGSISNILILMLWIYILAFIFVMGMALNASYYNNRDTDK